MKLRMSFPYGLFRAIFRWIFKIYFRWSIQHADRVPLEGPVILAANHCSYLDPPLVGSAIPREINYLARDSLFRFPIFGPILRRINAMPVDRDGVGPAGLKSVLRKLKAGEGILLFPEGTRSRDGSLQKIRSGIGLTVAKSKARVVPVRISGSFEAYGRHLKIPRPKKITVTFGEPLDLKALQEELKTADKDRLKELYQKIADRIMTEIAALPGSNRNP